MSDKINDPGVLTATQLFDLRKLHTDFTGPQRVNILPRFNCVVQLSSLKAGWLLLGPEGVVTDKVHSVNYTSRSYSPGLLATQHYQVVLFAQDSGQPVTDYAYGGSESPTGVLEGSKAMIGGGSMRPVFDQARAAEVIALMRERIAIAHRTHCPEHYGPVSSLSLGLKS